VGVSLKVWLAVVSILRVPHFSFTNRMGFQHEFETMPLVLGTIVQPKLPAGTVLWLVQDPRPCHAHRVSHHVCCVCYEEAYMHNERLGVLVCGYCGEQAPYHEHFSYTPFSRARVLPRIISDDFYKRTIYFRDWLRRMQAKERCHITADELKLVKTNAIRPITYWGLKETLKLVGMQKYYDHVVYIMKELRGRPLFEMTRSQEEVLIKSFCQLRRAFLSLSKSRVNMLSYPYLISKLCELQGWTKVARIIPTLKSPSRIRDQDELWYSLCRHMHWQFIPTP